MKKNCIRALVCLCLVITLLLPLPAAMAEMEKLDLSLIPDNTIAVFLSPEKENQPRIVFALHDITKDEEFLYVNVRQICTDPQLVVYDDYLSNVSELHIRQTSEFTQDTPIVGSYCEALIQKDLAAEDFHDQWCMPESGHIRPNGYYMDEQMDFSLSELKDVEGPIELVLRYFCNPFPGEKRNRIIHEITIDLADYLQ
ncbi:MAG: hypothetical protein J6K73_15275 [Clostridia bacterium]|nr:hypothetical protein [Clostridia bacterium]